MGKKPKPGSPVGPKASAFISRTDVYTWSVPAAVDESYPAMSGTCRAVPPLKIPYMMRGIKDDDTGKQQDVILSMINIFTDHIITWNLTDESGAPVPVCADSIIYLNDGAHTAILQAICGARVKN
jgi:hypothetical protein